MMKASGNSKGMKMVRKTAPTLLSLAMLMPSAAAALGLGDIHLRSALGQPLDAEIDLTAVAPGETESIRVGLASYDVFSRAGVDYPSVLTSLQFNVVRSESGRNYIDITSNGPIREPYLDFLIEVSWPNGRIVREYTILLDPPDLARPETPPAVQPARAETQVIDSGRRTVAAAPVAGARGLSYGPVKENETLWTIARQMRPDPSLSVQQIMVALVRANPQAFHDGNMNRLKAGYVLRLDDPSLITALTRDEVIAEVARQNRAWQDFKQHAAGEAAETPTLPAEPAPEKSSAAEESQELKLLTPKADEQAAEPQPTEETPAGTAVDKEELEPIKRDLMLALEGAEALQQENQELRKRMQELEGQLASMQRLLSLKSNELTAIQEQAQPEPAPTPASTSTPSVDEAPASFIEHLIKTVRSNHIVMVAAGVVVASLLFIGLLFARRRRTGGFQESILTGGTSSMLAASKGQGEGDSSLFSDLAVSGMSNIHADDNEVDPLTEAEVYIAYGRYKQALELLTTALAQQPDRPEILVKLLEVHRAEKDVDAFEERARQVFSLLEGTGPLWDKVVAMGRELRPDNPLFAVAPEAASDSAGPASREPAFREEDVLDIGLDMEALAEEMESSSEGSSDFDLDLDFSDLDVGDGEERDRASSADEAVESGFGDMDLGDVELGDDRSGGVATGQQAEGTASDEAQDLGGEEENPLEFDLGSFSEPAEPAAEADLQVGEEDAHTLEFDTDILSGSETGATAEDAGSDIAGDEDTNGLEFDLGTPEAAEPVSAEAGPTEEVGSGLELEAAFGELGADSGIEELATEEDVAGPEAAPAPADDIEVAAETAASEPTIDVGGLADETVPDPEAGAEEPSNALEFDLGGFEEEVSAAGEDTREPGPGPLGAEEDQPSEGGGLDFDFSNLGVPDEALEAIGTQAEDEQAAARTEEVVGADESLEDLLQEFELDDLADGGADSDLELEPDDAADEPNDPFADMDTVATKLDLARAYIDMGDAEGARRILDEVVNEGDTDQQQEAKTLLTRIA